VGSVGLLSSILAFGGWYFDVPHQRFAEFASVYRKMIGNDAVADLLKL
jgi:hypothetical protein